MGGTVGRSWISANPAQCAASPGLPHAIKVLSVESPVASSQADPDALGARGRASRHCVQRGLVRLGEGMWYPLPSPADDTVV